VSICPLVINHGEKRMPAKRELTMRQIRYTLLLVSERISARQIGRMLGVACPCSRPAGVGTVKSGNRGGRSATVTIATETTSSILYRMSTIFNALHHCEPTWTIISTQRRKRRVIFDLTNIVASPTEGHASKSVIKSSVLQQNVGFD
jgi:hypothetical protein